MSKVYLALGSNKGDREEYIKRALKHISLDEDIEIKKTASIIETEPEGNINQGKFLNSALKVETFLDPYTLFKRLKNIERFLGRKESGEKWAPREIDIDILLFDDLVIKGKNLRIPHPLMHKRYFVLKPLSEVAPDILHPVYNKSILELLNGLKEDEDNKKPEGDEQGIQAGPREE